MQTTERETVDAAIVRLAGEAAALGITVFSVQGPKGTQWFSPSQSRPGTAYQLTAVSCSCEGFIRWQRCRHLAALLDRLGWLPTGDPAPPAAPVALAVPTAPCPDCHGEGHRRMSTGGGLRDWVMVECRCRRAAA